MKVKYLNNIFSKEQATQIHLALIQGIDISNFNNPSMNADEMKYQRLISLEKKRLKDQNNLLNDLGLNNQNVPIENRVDFIEQKNKIPNKENRFKNVVLNSDKSKIDVMKILKRAEKVKARKEKIDDERKKFVNNYFGLNNPKEEKNYVK